MATFPDAASVRTAARRSLLFSNAQRARPVPAMFLSPAGAFEQRDKQVQPITESKLMLPTLHPLQETGASTNRVDMVFLATADVLIFVGAVGRAQGFSGIGVA